jgi:hypothetical protein
MNRSQADILNSKAGMARLLHPLASRQQLLMALASSTGGQAEAASSRDCVVAGLLGNAEQWKRFELAWRRSAIEAAAPRGMLEDSRPEQSRALADLIDTCRLTAIGSRVAGEEYAGLSPEMRRDLTGGRPAEPSILCFRHCLREAARKASKLPPEEKVCFVLDGQDDLSAQAAWLFEEIKSLEPAPVHERLGALGFEPKRHFAALQAAEWLTRELLPPSGINGSKPGLRGRPGISGTLPQRLNFKSFDQHALRLLQRDGETHRREWNRSVSGM